MPSSQICTSASLPVMTPRDRKDTTPLSRSVPLVPEWLEHIYLLISYKSHRCFKQAACFICVIGVSRLAESPDGDNDSSSWRSHVQSEELMQTMESSTSTDSSLVEGKQSHLYSCHSDAVLNFWLYCIHAIDIQTFLKQWYDHLHVHHHHSVLQQV